MAPKNTTRPGGREPVRAALNLRLNALAVVTGVVAGVGAALFRSLIAFFHNLLFLGRLDPHYDALAHTDASPWGAGIIAVPVIGAVALQYLSTVLGTQQTFNVSLVMGLLLMAVVLLLPNGIAPALQRLSARITGRAN